MHYLITGGAGFIGSHLVESRVGDGPRGGREAPADPALEVPTAAKEEAVAKLPDDMVAEILEIPPAEEKAE